MKGSNWWTGPHWLGRSEYAPVEERVPVPTVQINHIYVGFTRVRDVKFWKEYSDLNRMIRAQATLTRAINRMKGIKVTGRPYHFFSFKKKEDIEATKLRYCMLTQKELDQALIDLIRISQKESYPTLYKQLQAGKKPTDQDYLKFAPVFDENDRIIRCMGRQPELFRQQQKQPLILLHPDHHVTKVILRHEHIDKEKGGHFGLKAMTVNLRSTYWIPSYTTAITKALETCVLCKRFNARAYNELPATLPLPRLTVADPFTITGIDYAGPFEVLEYEPQTDKVVFNLDETPPVAVLKGKPKHTEKQRLATIKVYILLFTCAVTRAVHLEVTKDLSSTAFINAYRRFIVYRFTPKIIYSDNAKTFVAASKYIDQIYNTPEIQNYLANRDVAWRFSANLSSWWGGFWERMVKTTKQSLYKTFGAYKMEQDLFCTAVAEISQVINNRPLVWIERDNFYLTPNQLLKGGFCDSRLRGPAPNELELGHGGENPIADREFARRKLVSSWWTSFNQLYLKDVERFHIKSPGTIKSVQVGQVVLVKDDKDKRIDWKLARVTGIKVGHDGISRLADITMLSNNGKIMKTNRAVQMLFPLEAKAGFIDADYRETETHKNSDWVTSWGKILNKNPIGGVSESDPPSKPKTGRMKDSASARAKAEAKARRKSPRYVREITSDTDSESESRSTDGKSNPSPDSGKGSRKKSSELPSSTSEDESSVESSTETEEEMAGSDHTKTGDADSESSD